MKCISAANEGVSRDVAAQMRRLAETEPLLSKSSLKKTFFFFFTFVYFIQIKNGGKEKTVNQVFLIKKLINF